MMVVPSTVGASTGTLAGMYYKMDDIPKEWLRKSPEKKILIN
ncbi:hypothetical protein [Peribacillus frigoritolerans]|nr:hypothetical protein [Peribacillus frigoritolerans]